MGHLGRDLMKLGPRPTLARETPVAVINLLITAALVVVLVAFNGGLNTTITILGTAIASWTVVVWIYVAARPRSSASRRQ